MSDIRDLPFPTLATSPLPALPCAVAVFLLLLLHLLLPLPALVLPCLLLLLFCAQHLPATLFSRPHPALWRLTVGAGLLYSLCLAYLFCLPRAACQELLQRLVGAEHATGTAPLLQRSYAEDCSLTLPNVAAQLDIFVLAHLVGWAGKAFMFRDFWLTMSLSFTFELLEYSFEYLQVRRARQGGSSAQAHACRQAGRHSRTTQHNTTPTLAHHPPSPTLESAGGTTGSWTFCCATLLACCAGTG